MKNLWFVTLDEYGNSETVALVPGKVPAWDFCSFAAVVQCEDISQAAEVALQLRAKEHGSVDLPVEIASRLREQETAPECPECGLPVFETPGGMTCSMGHGGLVPRP